MPNIPTRERPNMPPRPRMPQNVPQNMQQRNLPQRQYIPPRVVYDPRKAPPRNINYKQLQRPPAVKGQRERINPIRPTKKTKSLFQSIISPRAKKQPKKKYKYKERTVTQEFILGFVVGALIFGIAAIFICNALIGLFT